MSVVPSPELTLVPEPKSRSADTEMSLLKELDAKKRAAKKAVQDRKKSDKAHMDALAKKEALTRKKELRELQKTELEKPVIDYQHNGVWDTMADKRNDDKMAGALTPAEAARAKAQKEVDRKIQKEREESEAEDRAFALKQQRKAERMEADQREKVRLKQAADRKAEKEEARKVKAEMEARNKEVQAREAAVAKDKLMDALKERRTILAKKEKDEAYAKKQLADWKRDMDETRERDNVKEQREKAEAAAEEKARRKAQLKQWKEQEAERLAEEAAAAAKAKEERAAFHAHAREKAIKEEMLKLQFQLDAEQIEADAHAYEAERIKKEAEAAALLAASADAAVSELKSTKGSFIKLW